ncbi:MAG: serpin family protein [Oscillospiraceae bacterium]|nr:serpin family protein [Oscillospiraceae bacterium]
MKKTVLALLLACFIIFSCACSNNSLGSVAQAPSSNKSSSQAESQDNLSSESSQPPSPNTDDGITKKLSEGFTTATGFQSVALKGKTGKTAADFSYSLFKNAYSDSANTLISPASVMYALAMAANGAENNTLKQIEEALGADRDTINKYLRSYMSSLPIDGSTLSLSQSVWVNLSCDVKNSFLQTNADYFNADIFSAPMNMSTVNDINKWVSDKTDGEIDRALNSLSADDLLVLINATLFEGKWENEYKESSIRKGDFYNSNNSKARVNYLYSSEDIYISGEGYSGFVKPYAGERFAFAALLPDSEASLSSLVSSLDGKALASIIENASHQDVSVAIPEFSIKCDTPLIEILKKMGITDAFDSKADFSSMSSEKVYLSEVDHKTSIKLNRHGTKAAASTVIKATRGSYTKPKSVILNKPFLYVIYDTEADIPAFIGTVTNLS